jgi:hypothetical protein
MPGKDGDRAVDGKRRQHDRQQHHHGADAKQHRQNNANDNRAGLVRNAANDLAAVSDRHARHMAELQRSAIHLDAEIDTHSKTVSGARPQNEQTDGSGYHRDDGKHEGKRQHQFRCSSNADGSRGTLEPEGTGTPALVQQATPMNGKTAPRLTTSAIAATSTQSSKAMNCRWRLVR